MAVAPAATVLAVLVALAALAKAVFAEPASAPATLAATVAIEIAAFAPLAAVEAVAMRPQHPRQHGEAGFLAIVEALIKRRAGIGDLLERDAALAHGVGALGQPIERRGRSLRLILLLRRLAGLDAIDAQLHHVAQRRLECRPVFRLVRSQFESGLQRCDARVGERGHVVGAEPMAVLETRAAVAQAAIAALLRVHEGRAGDGKHGRRGDYGLEHGHPPQMLLVAR